MDRLNNFSNYATFSKKIEEMPFGKVINHDYGSFLNGVGLKDNDQLIRDYLEGEAAQKNTVIKDIKARDINIIDRGLAEKLLQPANEAVFLELLQSGVTLDSAALPADLSECQRKEILLMQALHGNKNALRRVKKIQDLIAGYKPEMTFEAFETLLRRCGFHGDIHTGENTVLAEDSPHGKNYRRLLVAQLADVISLLEQEFDLERSKVRNVKMLGALTDESGCFAAQIRALSEAVLETKNLLQENVECSPREMLTDVFNDVERNINNEILDYKNKAIKTKDLMVLKDVRSHLKEYMHSSELCVQAAMQFNFVQLNADNVLKKRSLSAMHAILKAYITNSTTNKNSKNDLIKIFKTSAPVWEALFPKMNDEIAFAIEKTTDNLSQTVEKVLSDIQDKINEIEKKYDKITASDVDNILSIENIEKWKTKKITQHDLKNGVTFSLELQGQQLKCIYKTAKPAVIRYLKIGEHDKTIETEAQYKKKIEETEQDNKKHLLRGLRRLIIETTASTRCSARSGRSPSSWPTSTTSSCSTTPMATRPVTAPSACSRRRSRRRCAPVTPPLATAARSSCSCSPTAVPTPRSPPSSGCARSWRSRSTRAARRCSPRRSASPISGTAPPSTRC